MNKHESLVQIIRNTVAARPYVLKGVKKNIVGIFIITQLLLLLCYVNSNFDSLLHITNRTVELESPLGLFGLVINLSKQVIDKFMS
jgi:hypothetical protein